MKKIFIFLFLTFFSFSIFAQDLPNENLSKRNELTFKIGYLPPLEYFILAMSSINFSINEEVDPDEFCLPSFSLEYLRYFNDRIGVGGTLTYGLPFALIGEKDNLFTSYLSFQANFRFIYKAWDKVKLFGELGAGGELLMCFRENFYEPFFSAHVSPIGIIFGKEDFFGSAEVTAGSEGMILTLGGGFRF